MIIINIGLPKTMTTELRNYIDKYTNINVLNKQEISFEEALNINYKELDRNKIYYYKNPNFIRRLDVLEKLIQIINDSNHKLFFILGVRNIIDNIYSLFYHFRDWENGKVMIKDKLYISEIVYTKHLSAFYNDIKKHIDFLKKYNTIIYNINNCNFKLNEFLKKIFNLMEIEVKISENYLMSI